VRTNFNPAAGGPTLDTGVTVVACFCLGVRAQERGIWLPETAQRQRGEAPEGGATGRTGRGQEMTVGIKLEQARDAAELRDFKLALCAVLIVSACVKDDFVDDFMILGCGSCSASQTSQKFCHGSLL